MLSELFSKLELVSKAKSLLVGVSREGLPLSEGGQHGSCLSNDSDQCLGHVEGTLVKADIGHFTLLIKLLLLKLINKSVIFLHATPQHFHWVETNYHKGQPAKFKVS